MNVTLKLNAKSCRRTRNRIREHGPIFRAERSGTHKDHPHNVDKLIGLCWLLRAEDGWLGWLPRDEFDWTHTDARPRGDWKKVVPWKQNLAFRDMMPDSREFYMNL